MIAYARLKLEKYCSSHAVHCKGRKSRGNLRLALLLLMPAQDSQIQKTKEHAGKVRPKIHGSYCQQRACGKFSPLLGTSANLCSRSYVNTRKPKPQQTKNGKREETSGLGRKGSKIQGKSRPSSEARWKNRPLREPDGLLSLESRNILLRLRGRHKKMFGRSRTWDPCGTNLQNTNDLGDPTPLIGQGYLDARKERQRLISRQFSLKPSRSKVNNDKGG